MTAFSPQGRAATGRVLMVDNYDSFTFNLVQYLLELGVAVDVVRNDAASCEELLAQPWHAIVLSPGPGGPQDSGVCQELCRTLAEPSRAPGPPLLGVCLGQQTLCEVLGATVERAARIMHGKVSNILHEGEGIFCGLPSPFSVTRYHSLIVREDTLPPALKTTARTPEGELMAVAHRTRPLFGVQFHPESILTEHGHRLLQNFLSVRP